jgi:transposase
MSGITLSGNLFTLTRTEALTGLDSICFLKHLVRQVGERLLVIWDSSPIHRSAEVKAYLAEGAAKRIHLERLPPYAPDLNPDEGVWQHLKHVEMRNLCCPHLGHLHAALDLAILRVRRKPRLVQSFFAGAGLTV